jgi:hypothetical protein
MNKKFYFTVFLLIIGTLIFVPRAFCRLDSSAELIEHAKDFEGKTVYFRGEAIGDIMKRGNFAWVNVNDGANALGIWLETGLAKKINYTGSYKAIGDTVLIVGRFNRACLEHGGDLDIHAESLAIIKTGNAVEEKINAQKYKAALGLLGVALCFGILRILRRSPRKK